VPIDPIMRDIINMERPTFQSTLPENQSGASLRDLLHVLCKRKLLVLLFFLSTVSTITLVCVYYTKPLYQATAQLLLVPGTDLGLPPSTATAQRLSFSLEEETARAIDLLTGRSLSEQVTEKIGPTTLYKDLATTDRGWFARFSPQPPSPDARALFERAVARVLENVVAEPSGKASLLNLSFRHEDPAVAAQVVNLLGALYIERHMGVRKNPKTDAFFHEQFQVQKQKLQESESLLEDFKRQHNISISVKDEQETTLKQEAMLQAALGETLSLQHEAESRLAQLRSQLSNTSRTPGIVTALREKLTTLELEETALALRFKPENPTLRSLRAEILRIRSRITEEEAAKPYGTIASRDGSLYGNLQAQLLHDEAEQKALRAREQIQNTKLTELKKRLDDLEPIATQFNHLQLRVQMEEQNYRLYLTKFEESRIANAMDAEKIASVRVIEPARVPSAPLNSKLALKILLGVFFGLFGGIALAFGLQLTNGRLETSEDVGRYLELPVLASIPRLKLR
jgi:polysaccharide biosynthesis protein PslE